MNVVERHPSINNDIGACTLWVDDRVGILIMRSSGGRDEKTARTRTKRRKHEQT